MPAGRQDRRRGRIEGRQVATPGRAPRRSGRTTPSGGPIARLRAPTRPPGRAGATRPAATCRPGARARPLDQTTASIVSGSSQPRRSRVHPVSLAPNRPITTTGGGGPRSATARPTARSGIMTPGGTTPCRCGPTSELVPRGPVGPRARPRAAPARGQPPPGSPSIGWVQACGSAQARSQPATATTSGAEARAVRRRGHRPRRATGSPANGGREAPGVVRPRPRASVAPVVSSRTTHDRRGGSSPTGMPGGVVGRSRGPARTRRAPGGSGPAAIAAAAAGSISATVRGRTTAATRIVPDAARGQRLRRVEAAVGDGRGRDLQPGVEHGPGSNGAPSAQLTRSATSRSPHPRALVVHPAPGSSARPTMTTGIGSSGLASSKAGGRRTPGGIRTWRWAPGSVPSRSATTSRAVRSQRGLRRRRVSPAAAAHAAGPRTSARYPATAIGRPVAVASQAAPPARTGRAGRPPWSGSPERPCRELRAPAAWALRSRARRRAARRSGVAGSGLRAEPARRHDHDERAAAARSGRRRAGARRSGDRGLVGVGSMIIVCPYLRPTPPAGCVRARPMWVIRRAQAGRAASSRSVARSRSMSASVVR